MPGIPWETLHIPSRVNCAVEMSSPFIQPFRSGWPPRTPQISSSFMYFSIAAEQFPQCLTDSLIFHPPPPQVEMTGSSIFDYCHAGDHEEIAEQLGLSLTGPSGLTSPSSAVGSDEGTGSQGTCHNIGFRVNHTLSVWILVCELSNWSRSFAPPPQLPPQWLWTRRVRTRDTIALFASAWSPHWRNAAATSSRPVTG